MTYHDHLIPIAMYMAIGAERQMIDGGDDKYFSLSNRFSGHTGIMGELVQPAAEYIAAKLIEMNPEDYPGVFDYEVSDPLGVEIVKFAAEALDYSLDDFKPVINKAIAEFFLNGASDVHP